MWPFAAHADTHPGRPAGQVEQAGQFGDGGTLARLAVAVVGRAPRRLGDESQQLRGIGRQAEPGGVGQPAAVQPAQHLMGRTGTIDADQHFPAVQPGGQLGQRGLDDGDVIGGSI